LEAALHLIQPDQDREYEAIIYTHLALVNDARGARDDAIEQANRALAAAKATKDQILIANALVALGRIQGSRGNPGESVKTLQTALRIYQAAPNPQGEAAALK
jgi:tetratricopeptide (TPR) repeat protein